MSIISSDASFDPPRRGRPPRSSRHGAAKNYATVRLHPGEVPILKSRQRMGGFCTRSDTIREALNLPVMRPTRTVRAPVPAVIDREAFQHLAQIGNNINQIARVLNSALASGTLSGDLVAQINRELTRIRQEAKAP